MSDPDAYSPFRRVAAEFIGTAFPLATVVGSGVQRYPARRCAGFRHCRTRRRDARLGVLRLAAEADAAIRLSETQRPCITAVRRGAVAEVFKTLN